MAKTTPNAKSNDDIVIKPWKRISSTVALDEKWFPVSKHKTQLPSGTIVDDYFVWNSPDIALAVPITEDGKFVICEQYRFAIDQLMFQFPAGGINKNELKEDAARREMEEETGYIGGELTYLGKCSPFGSKMTTWEYVYLIKGVRPGGNKADDENEPSKNYLKTPEEIMSMIESGELVNSGSLSAALLVFQKLGYLKSVSPTT